jgi:predicted solute-binding protein
VASVAIFHRVPLRDVRSIALDTSSRTSVALTKIVCVRQLGISPVFVPHAPDLAAMLASADAALLIGDPALFVDHRALGADKLDLGEAWTTMTGLPFVWAFWAGRADAAPPWVVSRLGAAAKEGFAHLDAIADAYLAGDPARQAVGRRYLREHLTFRLDTRALAGLRKFYRESVAVGAAAADRAVLLFDGAPA